MRPLLSLYTLRYPKTIAYMLQASEYQTLPYLKWIWRTRDFSRVQHRRQFDPTTRAKLMMMLLYGGMAFEIIAGILWIVLGSVNHEPGAWAFGLALILIYPLVWPYLIVLPLEAARAGVVKPKQQQQIALSEQVFSSHPAVKIAVAGSYGKTSMKEVLLSVLSEGKKVAATSANHNVPSEHAKFARSLDGDEDILVIEYGEGEPGDVARFAITTHPTHGVITGLAPAHLDKYQTLNAAGQDIFSLASYLKERNVYVNKESQPALKFIKSSYQTYGIDGVDGWKVTEPKFDIHGLSFNLSKGRVVLNLKSHLIGRHHIGTLALAAKLGLELGLSKEQVEVGISKTKPYEHRMQPYELSGAWIIDDTYNGNIDGVRAGTALLCELKAKRKIYVTPGLVDQGVETKSVHEKMGHLIAAAKPELVVLMQNSVTGYLKAGLEQAGFSGELRIETDPLSFYQNLEHFVAAGDLVLMQNDWPDNYA